MCIILLTGIYVCVYIHVSVYTLYIDIILHVHVFANDECIHIYVHDLYIYMYLRILGISIGVTSASAITKKDVEIAIVPKQNLSTKV